MSNQFSFLFSAYGHELKQWFKTLDILDDNILTVIYGQPSAAFRRIFTEANEEEGSPGNTNRKVMLPVLNFIVTNQRKEKSRTNPYVRSSGHLKSADPNETTSRDKAPQVYYLTYQCSLWTNNEKERDHIISQIYRAFNSSLTLKHYPEYEGAPDQWIWMPFSLEEEMSDNTDLETLPETETLDIIKTDFIITGESVLPFETVFSKQVKSIQINDTTTGESVRYDGELSPEQELKITINGDLL